jgi:hypothetical protein
MSNTNNSITETKKIKMLNFIKCELKFFGWLIIGLIVMTIISSILKTLFNYDYHINIIIGILIIGLNIIYVIFKFIKLIIFNTEYECKDLRERIGAWL